MSRGRRRARNINLGDMAAVCASIAAFHLCAGAAFSLTSEPVTISELRQAYAGAPETWPRPELREGAVFTEFGPLPPAPQPADNPSTPTKIALGRMLFSDPILSGSGQIACESCHVPELAFTDGVRTSFGHNRQRGRRNAPSLLTAAWMERVFWDGRGASLEDQVPRAIADPLEMAGDLTEIEQRLNASARYREAFHQVFGASSVTMEDVARALAAYQRSLRPSSRWDRVLRDGTSRLNDQQLQGLHIFRTKGGCANCHSGPLFTDQQFHDEGLSLPGTRNADLGRFDVTGDPADWSAFRTPSLRGVSRTAPYMHNGGFRTLDNVVTFYNIGGGRRRRPPEGAGVSLPPPTNLIQPLQLTNEEREALAAFLKTL